MKLSILIPTFNRERCIERAVRAGLHCSWPDWEIIVSDNCSTDGTVDIVRALARENAKIKLITNGRNLGPVPNWRQCLNAATGTHIHWLWSDDWVEPQFYDRTYQLLVGQSLNTAVVGAACVDVEDSPESSFIVYSKHLSGDAGKNAAGRVMAFWYNPQSPASSIIPRHLVVKNFYSNIGWWGEENVDAKGYGTDSLIMIGSFVECARVHYMNLPYVHFTSGKDAISKAAGGTRVVRRRYLAAHLWFIRKSGYVPTLECFIRTCWQAVIGRYWIGLVSLFFLCFMNWIKTALRVKTNGSTEIAA